MAPLMVDQDYYQVRLCVMTCYLNSMKRECLHDIPTMLHVLADVWLITNHSTIARKEVVEREHLCL